MCGIAGLLNLNDSEAGRLHGMLSVMKHRGPDHSGVYTDESVALGMVRLSILDPSEIANQPMASDCGNVHLIYNGEMYNFSEEKQKLEALGYVFKSGSDTEVVLKMYLEYGNAFLGRMRGMFALAVYDKRESLDSPKLILARDRFGIKPLLYWFQHHRLIFASEMKAMLQSGVIPGDIDLEALRLFFTYGSIKQPRTMIQDVRMLLPGHMMELSVENPAPKIANYVDHPFKIRSGLSELPYEGQKEVVYETLLDSVRKQLVSDVPLGAFLSGGIDSSLIVSLMKEAGSKHIKTFSVGFEAEGSSMDETRDAAIVAGMLETDHQRVVVTGEDFRADFYKIIRSLDQPSVDGVNSYFISKAAAGDVKVSLSGTGGDELFTGYPWFVSMLQYWEKYGTPGLSQLLAPVYQSRLFGHLANSRYPFSRGFDYLRSDVSFLSRFSRLYLMNKSSKLKGIFTDSVNRQISYPNDLSSDYHELDQCKNGSTLNRVSALSINGYLRNQLLRDIDVMSMAHSLEVRVPFIDQQVLEVALSISDRSKISENVTGKDPKKQTYRDLGMKKVLVDIGKKYLPDNYDEQTKRGFSMPFEEWMFKHTYDIVVDALSEETAVKRGIFNHEYLRSLKLQFQTGTFNWSQVWLFVVFEYWCREFID